MGREKKSVQTTEKDSDTNESSSTGFENAQASNKNAYAPRAKKSLFRAYFLFFFAWPTHLIYLERLSHALLAITTFNFFGLGIFRDLYRMPDYVSQVNLPFPYVELYKIRSTKVHLNPPSRFSRGIVMFVIGITYCAMFGWCFPLPDEDEDYVGIALHHGMQFVGGYLAVYLVLNASWERTTDVRGPFLSGIPAYFGSYYFGSNEVATGVMLGLVIATSLMNETWNRKMTQRRPAASRRWCGGCCSFLSGVLLLWVLAGLFWAPILHKTYTELPIDYEGESLTLQEMVVNAMNSDGWRELSAMWNEFKSQINTRGWEAIWNDILKELDVGGDDKAASVLGVDLSDDQLTESKLRRLRNKLALQYHPDRNLDKTETEQKEAEEKYRQIQEAYEKVVKILKNRENNQRRAQPDTTSYTTTRSSSSSKRKKSSSVKKKSSGRRSRDGL